MVESISFHAADQARFAAWSGDVNPLHMDPIAARRTQLGGVVAHGVHAVLWALEALCQTESRLIGALKIRFVRPIYVGDRMSLDIAPRQGQTKLTVVCSGASAVSLAVSFDPRTSGPADLAAVPLPPADWPREPIEHSFETLSGLTGALAIAPGSAGLPAAFPALARNIGPERLAGLAALSRLVGMVCPGLHSIFSAARVDLCVEDGLPDGLSFAVKQADDRFQHLVLEAAGCGLAASLEVIVRPAPVLQPSTNDIARGVGASEFAGARCLVVGGSRGLGEFTSKALAAGGAQVTLTYASGRADAERVARDIADFGGVCHTRRLDVTDPEAVLADLPTDVGYLYYFATCRLAQGKPGLFDAGLFDQFSAFYVDFFGRLCAAMDQPRQTPLRLFYPSTAAIETRPRGMTEYAMAKAAGEVLCQDVGRFSKHLEIVARRLPRLETDLTLSQIRVPMPSVAETLLPIIREVQGRTG